MFLKIVVLFFIGAVSARRLQDTPEELKEYFNDIDTEVQFLQSEAVVQIESNVDPLETYIQEAKTDIIQNLTTAAKPYWATIRSLQETAAQIGQDISSCVDPGNNALATLDSSIVDPATQAFDNYNETGHEIFDDSLLESSSVIKELNILGKVVGLCNDETCATNLKKTVTQFYQRAKNVITDAESKTISYVTVYLSPLLAEYSLDSHLYVTKYTLILDDVTTCINNL